MEYSYAWPQTGHLLFDGDDRVDRALFLLATQAWAFLDETLSGLSVDRREPDFASKVLLVYLAARIHGVSCAGTMLVAQRLGREAIIMGRCQYDHFLQMLFYDTYHHRAAEVLELVDAGVYDYQFWKSSGLGVSGRWSPEQIAELEKRLSTLERPNFTRDITETLRRDSEFLRASDNGNPFAKWFVTNIDASFRSHWRYGSSIVHASPVDIKNVVLPHKDGNFTINVDSRMKAPNKTIANFSQTCFSAMGLLRWRFNLEFNDRHISWAAQLTDIMQHHVNEPTDVRSMHD